MVTFNIPYKSNGSDGITSAHNSGGKPVLGVWCELTLEITTLSLVPLRPILMVRLCSLFCPGLVMKKRIVQQVEGIEEKLCVDREQWQCAVSRLEAILRQI